MLPFTQASEFSTQGSQVDNYAASTGSFNDRMKHWMDAVTDYHQIQCAVCFKAGVAINLSLMTKDPDKYRESITKYKMVADSLSGR